MQKYKVSIIIALVIIYLSVPNHEYFGYNSQNTWQHFAYMFFHANIFHLIGNCIALYFVINNRTYKTKLLLPFLYLVSVVGSYLDFTTHTTIGISSILFVMVGINYYSFPKNISKYGVIITLSTGLLLPHVNGVIHIICFTLGYGLTKLLSLIKLLSNDCRRFN